MLSNIVVVVVEFWNISYHEHTPPTHFPVIRPLGLSTNRKLNKVTITSSLRLPQHQVLIKGRGVREKHIKNTLAFQ